MCFYYGGIGGLTAVICMRSALFAVRARRPGSKLLATGLLFLIRTDRFTRFIYLQRTALPAVFYRWASHSFALFQSGSLAHAHAALERHNSEMHERLESSRKALESQRKQIEANLHDSLGGNLTDIKLGLEALVKDAREQGD
jgi:signal transduction histidine kinase